MVGPGLWVWGGPPGEVPPDSTRLTADGVNRGHRSSWPPLGARLSLSRQASGRRAAEATGRLEGACARITCDCSTGTLRPPPSANSPMCLTRGPGGCLASVTPAPHPCPAAQSSSPAAGNLSQGCQGPSDFLIHFSRTVLLLTLQNTPGPSRASPVSALESAITPELLGSLHLRPEWGVAIAAGATALQALRVEVVMRRLTHMHMHSHMHAHTHVHTPVLIAYLPLCVRTK